jgi:RHS repeat-associated protein
VGPWRPDPWTATAATDDRKLEGGTGTAYTTEREFDALNRQILQSTPDAKETTYTYDEYGHLYSVAVDGTDYVGSITYNARGQREELTYGNGTVTTYTYEPETFRLVTLTTTRSSSDRIQALTYTYDPVGNLLGIADAAQDTTYFKNTVVSPSQSFEYDALYRLLHAEGREKLSRGQTYNGDPAFASAYVSTSSPPYESEERYEEDYAYDAVGNILSMQHSPSGGGGWTRDYAYEVDGSSNPISNRLVSTTESVGTVYYQHDARGNVVFLPHLYNNGATPPAMNVTSDFRDQMARAQINSADYALYYYDANGQRVRKIALKGANTEERRYLGAYEVWSKTGTSTEGRQTLHVMDGEKRIAMIETNTVSSAVRKRYQLGNHLGTSVLEIDEGENIISYEEYHPYGTTAWWAGTSDTEVSAKRYRYTGKEKDDETGLYYHGARYYAPWLGRWTSADPIGLGDGVNRFAYCHGNPTRGRDPTGMAGIEDDEREEAEELFEPARGVETRASPVRTPPEDDTERARWEAGKDWYTPQTYLSTLGNRPSAEEVQFDFLADTQARANEALSRTTPLSKEDASALLEYREQLKNESVDDVLEPTSMLDPEEAAGRAERIETRVGRIADINARIGRAPEETVSLWRAPRAGREELTNGYSVANHPKDAFSDGNAYFAGPNSRSLAEEYARHGPYEDGVLEVRIDKATFEEQFRPFESPYQGGPDTEVPVPQEMFDLLNSYPRFFYPTGAK